MKIPKEENDCKVVYTALFDLNKMVVSKIQSKIANIFVLRKSTTLEFAERVRESLATIGSVGEAVGVAVATLLGCAQKDLHQRQYAEMHLFSTCDTPTSLFGRGVRGYFLCVILLAHY